MVITGALRAFLEFRAGRLAAIERKRKQDEEKQHEAQRAELERKGGLLTAEEWKEISWLFNF